MPLSLNERALTRAEELAADAEALGAAVQTLSNGTRVIDCGVDAPGGLEAGRIFSEVCMGGLGSVTFTHLVFLNDWWLPALKVYTDQPMLACMAAQYAGWSVSKDDYFAMGSGPARALIRAETELYDELGYSDIGDSFEDMKRHAKRRGFKFPYLYDGDTQRVSTAFGVLATPHVFVFDQRRRLRYNGRIDDSDVKPPKSHDTRNAIEDLLAGKADEDGEVLELIRSASR